MSFIVFSTFYNFLYIFQLETTFEGEMHLLAPLPELTR
jgi:hypothetical protein